MAPYPLQTTLLAFADDMAVITATARQPLPNAPNDTRANQVHHNFIIYLENNRLLVHNIKSATKVYNPSPPPLRPVDPPMTGVATGTYLGIKQAASSAEVNLPPNLERGLTCTLIFARIAAVSTQALAYFLRAVLNAAIVFQPLHQTDPKQKLRGALTTMQRVWAVNGQGLTSLPAEVTEALAQYYGDSTNHLVQNAYTAHTAAHLHRLMHNQEHEVRQVFTVTLREAPHQRNTCPQCILHQRGLPTTVRTRELNDLQLPLPHNQHVIRMSHWCNEAGPLAILHTDVGRGPTGEATILDHVGTSLHLVRVTPSQMRVLQQGGPITSAFWNPPIRPANFSVKACYAWLPPQPADCNPPMGRSVTHTVCSGAGTNSPYHRAPRKKTRPTTHRPNRWGTYRRPRYQQASYWNPDFSNSPCGRNKNAGQHVDATPTHGTQIPPASATTGLTDGQTYYMLAMRAPSTGLAMAHPSITGTAPAHTGGPSYPRIAPVVALAVRTGPSGCDSQSDMEARYHDGVVYPPRDISDQAPSPHLPGLGKAAQRHARCPAVARATPLLVQDSGERDHRMDHVPPQTCVPAPMHTQLPRARALKEQPVCANECGSHRDHSPGDRCICHPPKSNQPPPHRGPLQQEERVSTPNDRQPHAAYPGRTTRPSCTISLTLVAGGAALELPPEVAGQLRQHLLTGATTFRASSHGELKTLAIIVDTVGTTCRTTHNKAHHVWVVVDAAVHFQIIRRLTRQPLHKATDSSLGTQAQHLSVALRNLPGHIVLHVVKQESHCYNFGYRHIDLHIHNQLPEDMPKPDKPPLQDHMHAHLQHLSPVPHPGERPPWLPKDVVHNDRG